MLVPGAEFPHFCAQCEDYPCVKSCPQGALSINRKTEAVLVDEQKCTACGICIEACPGRVPHLHPVKKTILICDLCNGNPQCAKVCQEAKFNALQTVFKGGGWEHSYRVYSRKPEDVTKELIKNLYGEAGEAYI
jgi:Fe-S-cluster-containing hydrogenase component 2